MSSKEVNKQLFQNKKIAVETEWSQFSKQLIQQVKETGKEIAEGFASKQIATFMLWKVGFFTTEAFMELAHSNGDAFFKELFRESEKISLGMTALIFSGAALQYVIPKIPDINMPYLHFFNPCLEAYSKM